MKRGLGILCFVFGIFLFLNSFHGITGFAITEKIHPAETSVIGIAFWILGIFLFSLGNFDHKIKNLKLKDNRVMNLFEKFKN